MFEELHRKYACPSGDGGGAAVPTAPGNGGGRVRSSSSDGGGGSGSKNVQLLTKDPEVKKLLVELSLSKAEKSEMLAMQEDLERRLQDQQAQVKSMLAIVGTKQTAHQMQALVGQLTEQLAEREEALSEQHM